MSGSDNRILAALPTVLAMLWVLAVLSCGGCASFLAVLASLPFRP